MGTKVPKIMAPNTKKPITLYLLRFLIAVNRVLFLRFKMRNTKAVLRIRTS